MADCVPPTPSILTVQGKESNALSGQMKLRRLSVTICIWALVRGLRGNAEERKTCQICIRDIMDAYVVNWLTLLLVDRTLACSDYLYDVCLCGINEGICMLIWKGHHQWLHEIDK